MKKLFFPLIILLSILISCEDRISETVTYWVNEPVFMEADEFRNSVKINQVAHEITGYGKISFYNGYLYMSEPGKGIHIINNQNPANPQIAGYIELLGNADISIRENILYADSYIDLVWFDVSNPAQPVFVGRLENVFPEAIPFVDNEYGIDYEMIYNKKQDKVVVGWNEVKRTEQVEEYNNGWFWWWLKGDVYATPEINIDVNTGGNSINGSMSRFALYQDNLYVVINNQMQVFKLSGLLPERVVENFPVGFNVETIFSYGDHLFLGTPTGMLIYSVEDPVSPVWKSTITHAQGCDPVVVSDDIAYVTIRSGNACGQEENELIVIDVSDKVEPKMIETYKMTSPKGLGIDRKTLFVCDDGLKVYDVTDVTTIDEHLIKHFSNGFDGYDVIPYNNVLMMIADDGIHQYDYSNLTDIKEINGSFIPVNQTK
ncbi:MAG: hypothetical protein PHD30_08870 [Paludibacter sp.]|nr:hypothetical protein [Paludibacter sp.]